MGNQDSEIIIVGCRFTRDARYQINIAYLKQLIKVILLLELHEILFHSTHFDKLS